MVGNVWEWTGTAYKPYPYRAEDGRERMSADDDHVVRGGSWWTSKEYCRVAARVRYWGEYGGLFGGFRVAVSPFTSGL
jgi:toxoflavin biosynthesis protein ToxD